MNGCFGMVTNFFNNSRIGAHDATNARPRQQRRGFVKPENDRAAVAVAKHAHPAHIGHQLHDLQNAPVIASRVTQERTVQRGERFR